MQKTKQSRFAIVAILIFSMMAMYGYMPIVRAASLTAASDTISDSDVSESNVTHVVEFTTGQDLTATYMIDITFPAEVDMTSADATCPANSTAATSSQTVTCTVDGGQSLTAGDYSVTVTGTDNPGTAGGYTVQIVTETDLSVEVENGSVRFYILDDVTVTAHVDASLTFGVAGVASTTDVNGATCSVDTTATTTDFGTLDDTAPVTVCQELTVTTNATAGFSVTVFQSQNLTSAGGDEIDAFVDGTPAGAQGWTGPAETLGDVTTYGHFGLTSEDASLLAGDTFGAAQYVGFTGSTPMEVMYHDGPADGSTADIGLTQVAYTAEISAMQEAGDYTSSLTYVATATY